MSTLTQELADKYLDAGGQICPFCDSWDIQGGEIDIESRTAWQHVSCNACGATWTDDYEMVGVGQYDGETVLSFTKSKPELVGPCGFQIEDVAAQLANLNQANEDDANAQIERFVEDRDGSADDMEASR